MTQSLSGLSFDGLIAGASFVSGDQIVLGCWPTSPFRPFVDAMWMRSDGTRVLVIDDGPQAAFVRSHYTIEEVMTGSVGARVSADRVTFDGGGLTFSLELARRGIVSFAVALRPAHPAGVGAVGDLRGRCLRPLLVPVLGHDVRARGVTRAGMRERYVARVLGRS